MRTDIDQSSGSSFQYFNSRSPSCSRKDNVRADERASLSIEMVFIGFYSKRRRCFMRSAIFAFPSIRGAAWKKNRATSILSYQVCHHKSWMVQNALWVFRNAFGSTHFSGTVLLSPRIPQCWVVYAPKSCSSILCSLRMTTLNSNNTINRSMNGPISSTMSPCSHHHSGEIPKQFVQHCNPNIASRLKYSSQC